MMNKEMLACTQRFVQCTPLAGFVTQVCAGCAQSLEQAATGCPIMLGAGITFLGSFGTFLDSQGMSNIMSLSFKHCRGCMTST